MCIRTQNAWGGTRDGDFVDLTGFLFFSYLFPGLEAAPTVHSYQQQVVAGMKYKVKISIGDDFWHCDIIKPLPHTGQQPFVVEGSLNKGKSAEDPFEQ